MSQVKHYTTLLAVDDQDGHRHEFDLVVIPTGTSNTKTDSFWMLLLLNFTEGRYRTNGAEVQVSLHDIPASGQEN